MMSENKLNDDKMEQATGGLEDTDIASPDYGRNIKCPKCLQGDKVKYNSDIAHSEKYYCERCVIWFDA